MTPVLAPPPFYQGLHLHLAPCYPTPDISFGFDVSSGFFGFCTSYDKCICSKLVGHSCSLPLNPSCWGSVPPPTLGIPLGYCAFRFVVASFLVAPHGACNLGSQLILPHYPSFRAASCLSNRQRVYSLVANWSVPSRHCCYQRSHFNHTS